VHPILFQLGPLTLRSYGLATAFSFGLGILLSVYLNRKDRRPDDLILDLSTWVMLGAVAGARLLYVVVQPAEYLAHPWHIFAVWEGGLVFYGGLIGAGITGYLYLRYKKAPIWRVGDVVAPGLALGHVTGRLGCWFNGCCYGREDHDYGVVFPSLNDGIPHLPVMLYEAAFLLVLSAFLFYLWHHKRFHGQVFWAYVMLYASWRFCIEFLRGDPERGVLVSSALSPSQWISLVGVGLAFVMFYRLSRLPRTKESHP
jgi:phosphatidylglycerol:prolipoprotein diacylglycerol transferase